MKSADLGTALACPDCASETQIIELSPNVYAAAVIHDDTCPAHPRLRRGIRDTSC